MSTKYALIIDDDLDNLDVLSALLEQMGVVSAMVQDPTQIRAALRQLSQVDVIFLDLEMPDINGYEMLDILKEEMGIEAPVVAYTVHTSEINVAHDLGFDGFLGKPLDPERFPQIVTRILNGEQVWDVPD